MNRSWDDKIVFEFLKFSAVSLRYFIKSNSQFFTPETKTQIVN